MVENKSVKYLVYVDILGFEKLPEEIEKRENLSPRIVRSEILIEPTKQEIKNLKEGGKIFGVSEGRDDWILVLNDIDNIFEVVSRLLRIEISVGEYANKVSKDYGNIPLEIALGVYEFDKWAKLDGNEVVCNDEVIEFLKTYIIPEYHKTYKKENKEPITESFVICTDSFFDELKKENAEKYFCEREFTYEDKFKEKKTFYLLDKEKIIAEGKIPDFLNKIGQSKSDYSGALINRIFVPPDEYGKIKERLKNDRIVFITGSPGYGKTYTAIKLLWKKYNEGYTPKWISGKEKEERVDAREKLANIDAELKPKHIIYFEDPFGKTMYERRDDLKERINYIINSVKNKKYVFVIITSRKDVFEEFGKECYSVEQIKNFEEELNVIKPSYGVEKRKKILEEWANEKGCKWLKDEKLKDIVFKSLEKETTLPTPLSIYDFVIATINVNSGRELKQKIENYSRGAGKSFADEIKGLYASGRKDRILFLSFVFVSENFEVNFVKQEYERLKEKDFEDFEKILSEEYRVKESEGQLRFSHPSYSEALSYVLEDAGCRRIFCNVLKELAEKDYAAEYVVWAVADNFEKLPEEVRNLLFKLAEKDFPKRNVACDVAWAVADNFKKLPEEVRNKLLIKLAEKDSAAGGVAWTVAENFEKLPEEVRNLLFKLAGEDYAAEYVARAIANNFEKLPENIQNLLFTEKIQEGLKDFIEQEHSLNLLLYDEDFNFKLKELIKFVKDEEFKKKLRKD